MAKRIFISYRRADTQMTAGRLYDALAGTFGAASIFRDKQALKAGQDWMDEINSALTGDVVVLALIGPRWVNAVDAHGRRRLDDDRDSNRAELEAAIANKALLIPVLVEGAAMPTTDELPPSLHALTRRHALRLRDDDWDADLTRLADAVGSLTGRQSASGPHQHTMNWRRIMTLGTVGLLAAAIVGGTYLAFSNRVDTGTQLAPPAAPHVDEVREAGSSPAAATPAASREVTSDENRVAVARSGTDTSAGDAAGAQRRGEPTAPSARGGRGGPLTAIADAVMLQGPKVAANKQDKWVRVMGNRILVITDDGRIFVHDVGDAIANAYQLTSPKIAANPQDRWVLTMASRILVITADGSVFAHVVQGNTVTEASRMSGPKVAANPQDRWVLTLGNRIVVVTRDGGVFAHTVVGDTVSDPLPLKGPKVASNPQDKFVVALGSPRILVVTSDGRGFVHDVDFGANEVGNAYQLKGPLMAANPQDRHVLSLPVSNGLLVITETGEVFMHRLS